MKSILIYSGSSFIKISGILVLLTLLAGTAGAAMITVNASGGADYTRIQDTTDNSNYYILNREVKIYV